METLDYKVKYCIIGAGSSGLVAAKSLKQFKISFDVIERSSDVGGNWNYDNPSSRVYRSTHLISSKPMTQYLDYPMPKDYADYPSHWKVFEYFKAYARDFGLYSQIEFNRSVEKIEPVEGGLYWDVTLDNGQIRRYGGLIIANGHNWSPKYPEFPGHFEGQTLHSADYKSSEVLQNKRVLVIGAGNTGCDIAVEAAQVAQRTFHSSRRGYYYIPKYMFGMPSDQFQELFLKFQVPISLRRFLGKFLLWIYTGKYKKFNLTKPDHKLYESHLIVNSLLLYYIGQGDIAPKRDVKEFRGKRVLFGDGSEEEIDLVLYATGYNISFPFIDRSYLNWKNNRPELYLNIFHPFYDNLFVIGLIQPGGGQWGLCDYQSQAVARFIYAQQQHPLIVDHMRRLKGGPLMDLKHGIHYLNSTRHLLEVEHFTYRNLIKKLVKELDPGFKPPDLRLPSTVAIPKVAEETVFNKSPEG